MHNRKRAVPGKKRIEKRIVRDSPFAPSTTVERMPCPPVWNRRNVNQPGISPHQSFGVEIGKTGASLVLTCLEGFFNVLDCTRGGPNKKAPMLSIPIRDYSDKNLEHQGSDFQIGFRVVVKRNYVKESVLNIPPFRRKVNSKINPGALSRYFPGR
jgi:hypothetical protein